MYTVKSSSFSVMVLLRMQHKESTLLPYTVTLFIEMLSILCIYFSNRQQKSVAANVFHLFGFWIIIPLLIVSTQKRGDNGSAGTLSLPNPAGVTIKKL